MEQQAVADVRAVWRQVLSRWSAYHDQRNGIRCLCLLTPRGGHFHHLRCHHDPLRRRLMHPKTFTDQTVLYEYAERHHLATFWEGHLAYRKWVATLAPAQYEI